MKYLFGNWKTYVTRSEALRLALSLGKASAGIKGATVAAFPSALHLSEIAHVLKGSAVAIGAQNCGVENYGAETGEVSPVELKKLGIRYVLIGHSERRHSFDESEDLVVKRFQAAFRAGLTPVLCVGEALDEELASALVEPPTKHFLVAYEPISAIGTGKPADPEEVKKMHAHIRSALMERIGEAGKQVSILYGGSVEAKNMETYLALPEVDGLLVGRASTKSASLLALLRVFGKTSAL